MLRLLLAFALLNLCACRIESVTSGASKEQSAQTVGPSGDVWVYTSIYRPVLDRLDPLIREKLPQVKVHWYQAGSEKVASRLEAELAAGGTQADVIATSDPFLYERYKRERLLLAYVSPHALRIPRTLLDLDGFYSAARISSMVLVHRKDLKDPPPKGFSELTHPRWRNEVALGDPLTSGTAFTWAVFAEAKYGDRFFEQLRANGARVAGGNAAVLQRVEGRESKVGVMLLENALAAQARGSEVEFVYPEDGAVLVPGYLAIFRSSRNPTAAQAFVDVLLSPEGQSIIMREGDMHAVDPRVEGPRGQPGLETLLNRSQLWSDDIRERGLRHGHQLKATFSQAFSK